MLGGHDAPPDAYRRAGRALDDERDLVAGKPGATRLTFVILLKFYT
jgi:hypothetical protein